MNPYQPSNGSEEMWFTETYCMNCIHCDPHPCGDKQCDILCATMVYSINDPEYPKEWVYDEKDKPKCTKYMHWDWETNGNPDKPKPNAPIIPGPNQIKIPFTAHFDGTPKKETLEALQNMVNLAYDQVKNK